MKLASFVLLLMGAAALASAQTPAQTCMPVGGILFTNVGAIENRINSGVVYGDLAGTVSAAIIAGPIVIGPTGTVSETLLPFCVMQGASAPMFPWKVILS